MGRKKENKKKGEGAKKTQARSERAQLKALKKETGEDDIDTILNDIKKQDKARTAITITVCPTGPSPRSNAVFIAHPSPAKQELILFGGEYFNGKQTQVYNDLYVYNVTKNEWRHISSPNTPPPRSSAQAVALDREDGQIIVFGGEFTSPSGSQFHHYKDVWMLSLIDYRWQQLSGSSTKGGPSARSGHRMILYKHQIFCFGGFHDSGRDVKYYNDLHIFDLDTMAWLPPVPISAHSWPSPRSGFCFWNATDEHTTTSGTPPVAYLYGGYVVERTKQGKSDQPHVLWDLWQLHLEKHTWTQVKKKGVYPGPRSGIAATSTRGRGLLFGGCTDQTPNKTTTDNKEEDEDDEQDFESTFFNDLYVFVSDKQSFFPVSVRGTTHTPATTKQQQSHKQKQSQPEETQQQKQDTNASVFDFDPLAETLPTTTSSSSSTSTTTTATSQDTSTSTALPPPTPPCARRSAHLTCKGSWLYIYGGTEEKGTREITMSDLYQLDTSKSGGDWKCLVQYDTSQQVWEGSDDEDEDDGDEKEEEEGDDDDEEGEEDDEEEDEEEDEDTSFSKKESKESKTDVPVPRSNETLPQYFERTKVHWMSQALSESSSETTSSSSSEPTSTPTKPLPAKELRRRAFAAASQVYNDNK